MQSAATHDILNAQGLSDNSCSLSATLDIKLYLLLGSPLIERYLCMERIVIVIVSAASGA